MFCVCVCVCVRERERDRERQRQRERWSAMHGQGFLPLFSRDFMRTAQPAFNSGKGSEVPAKSSVHTPAPTTHGITIYHQHQHHPRLQRQRQQTHQVRRALDQGDLGPVRRRSTRAGHTAAAAADDEVVVVPSRPSGSRCCCCQTRLDVLMYGGVVTNRDHRSRLLPKQTLGQSRQQSLPREAMGASPSAPPAPWWVRQARSSRTSWFEVRLLLRVWSGV